VDRRRARQDEESSQLDGGYLVMVIYTVPQWIEGVLYLCTSSSGWDLGLVGGMGVGNGFGNNSSVV
jgi:hypothetical protein